MLTCCPQCGTTFRVSPQQLKVHQGEVRCGRCSAIFDAFDSLLAEPADSPQEPTAAPAAAESVVAEFQIAAPESLVPSADEPVPEAEPERRRELREMLPQFRTPAAEAGPAFAEPRKSGPRWPWAVLALFAAFALAGQVALRYRAELAATWPETRSWLERACARLNCVVSLPRHIELVSIDASDLQVDTTHSNLMLLTATLKNRAPFAQEHPALALTLTDTLDQPLARRVLTPADYLEHKTEGKTGFAANADFALKVYIDSRELKATGYRLFLFYP